MANFATSYEVVAPGIGSTSLNPTTDFLMVAFSAFRLSPVTFEPFPPTSASSAVPGLAAGGVAIF